MSGARKRKPLTEQQERRNFQSGQQCPGLQRGQVSESGKECRWDLVTKRPLVSDSFEKKNFRVTVTT